MLQARVCYCRASRIGMIPSMGLNTMVRSENMERKSRFERLTYLHLEARWLEIFITEEFHSVTTRLVVSTPRPSERHDALGCSRRRRLRNIVQ